MYDAGIDVSSDVAQGYSHSAGEFRVVVVKPTSTCRARFAVAANPYYGFAAARTAKQLSRLEKIG